MLMDSIVESDLKWYEQVITVLKSPKLAFVKVILPLLSLLLFPALWYGYIYVILMHDIKNYFTQFGHFWPHDNIFGHIRAFVV